MTAERRAARFDKYLEADPDDDWQASYAHLLDEPGQVRRWRPRAPQPLPVIANETVRRVAAGPGRARRLRGVVIARDDEAIIEAAVGAVVRQELDEPFEVIVVTSGTDRTAAIVRERFPSVHVVELDQPALPGAARNAGLRVARGGTSASPDRTSSSRRAAWRLGCAHHRQGWAMVTGTMQNGTRTWAGWATYFLENSAVLPARPSFVFETPPMRCSYVRDAVAELGGFPEDMRAGEDTVVNGSSSTGGTGRTGAGDGVSTHHSPCRRPGRLSSTTSSADGRRVASSSTTRVRRGPVVNRRVMRYVLLVNTVARLVRTTTNVTPRRRAPTEVRARPPARRARGASSWLGGCYELARHDGGGGRARAGPIRPATTSSARAPRDVLAVHQHRLPRDLRGSTFVNVTKFHDPRT